MKIHKWAVLLISAAFVLISVPSLVSAQPSEPILIQSTATIPNTALIQKAGIGITNDGDIVLGSTPVPTNVAATNNSTNETNNATLKATTTVITTNATSIATTTTASTAATSATPTVVKTTQKPTTKGLATFATINVTPTVWRTITPKSKSNAFVTGTVPAPKFTGKYPTIFTSFPVALSTRNFTNQSSYTHVPFQSWMWK